MPVISFAGLPPKSRKTRFFSDLSKGKILILIGGLVVVIVIGYIIFLHPFASLLAVPLGLVYFVKGLKRLKFVKLIEDMPTTEIRSIAVGLVEVKGQAFALKLLKSPLAGKDCVYWSYAVEEWRKSGKSHKWVRIVSAEKCSVA